MAGGPIFPSGSPYLGGASGNLSFQPYIPNTNTNNAGAIDGIAVIASLAADASVPLQFNLPEVIPSGTMKLRCLAMANATSGVAKLNIKSAVVAAGSSLGTSTLTQEGSAPTISQTWTTADVLVENKVNITPAAVANSILTILATFTNSGWTLAQMSVWQFSIVWE